MADQLERLKAATSALWRGRPRAILASLALIGALTAWGLFHRPHSPANTLQSAVVTDQPFSTSIDVVGVITPGERIVVTAPFDGTIKALAFNYGAPVKAGMSLATMDTFDVLQHRNDAEEAYLKAAEADRALASWAEGPEVARAHQAVTAAEAQLQATQHKAAETQDLVKRGLVARMEYDGLVQQQQSESLALATAQEELKATLGRGGASAKTEASIELTNTKARYADLAAQMKGAAVIAPTTGIIVRPPVDHTATTTEDIHVGGRVQRGQTLGLIAREGDLAVEMKLSEADALRVQAGQQVTVSGPGFGDQGAAGHIISVAGEATPSAGGDAAPTFTVIAHLDPAAPSSVRIIKFGMSANVSIITYATEHALVVPPAAVQGAGSAAAVLVRDKTGVFVRRRVVTGAAGPSGVQILQGVRAGDVVAWSTTAGASNLSGEVNRRGFGS